MVFITPNLLCMETESKKPKIEETTFQYWMELPPEIRQHVTQYLFELKDKSIESILNSYKKYLQLPKTISKRYRDELSEFYNNFLFEQLSKEDFKKLNKYIFDEIDQRRYADDWKFLPKSIINKRDNDLFLLMKLLAQIKKLDDSDKEHDFHTFLTWVSAYDQIDIAKMLIDAGADLNAKWSKNEWTPLMTAIMSGHDDIAKLLIDSGADINIKNYRGITALDLAIYQNNISIKKLLESKTSRTTSPKKL